MEYAIIYLSVIFGFLCVVSFLIGVKIGEKSKEVEGGSKDFNAATYTDLNLTLVRFWKDHGVKDKNTRIYYLELMLKWYKRMGYVTLYESKTAENGRKD